MAAISGRKVRVYQDGNLIGSTRTKTITFNNEPIDITSDDDGGFRTLLESDGEQAERSIDMSLEGVMKSADFIRNIADGVTVYAFTLEIETIGTVSGTFFLGNVELSGAYNDGVTFSADLQSSGPFAFVGEST